tara:strand:+ start:2080 stop:2922 length:843 start_codon:yes stop_codon:yes gene_type:complete
MTFRFPAQNKIIVIGDLHGDYKLTIMCLAGMKLINKSHNWCGGDTWVVQMGDQIDRGGRGSFVNDENSDIKILQLFNTLNIQANKQNGAVISLIGNHELMNVMGNYNYVSPLGISEFGGKQRRYNFFKPGGIISNLLSTRPVILKIGSWIFVHAGIDPVIVKKYKFDDINNLMRQFLLGDHQLVNNRNFNELFILPNSLLWDRTLTGRQLSRKYCNTLLKLLKCKYIVVGHTPQNKINSLYGKIWKVDTGMSEAFGTNSHTRMQVLEIINDGEIINIHKF